MKRPQVIVIVGPTAVGKTAYAIKLAKELRGEIISADSMQVYKRMDIISQKPSGKELKEVPHHLIGFLNPEDEYSAAIFSKSAQEIIRNIIERNQVPIITGGSGLYIKALVDGIFPSKGKDVHLRESLLCLAEEKGNLYLYKKLEELDQEAARKIHLNDSKRIIRAIEICELDKSTKTSLSERTKGIKDEYDVRIFGLILDRRDLYDRIDKRVDLMFRKGLVREVGKLLRRRNPSVTAMQALGIKEVKGYIKKEYDLQKAKDMLKRNTRRFAKRQLTWFRANKHIIWLDVGELSEAQILSEILRLVRLP